MGDRCEFMYVKIVTIMYGTEYLISFRLDLLEGDTHLQYTFVVTDLLFAVRKFITKNYVFEIVLK